MCKLQRRLITGLLAALVLLILFLAPPFPIGAHQHRIDLLTIKGAISPPLAGYIRRGLEEAQKNDSSAVIIRMDTPGGLDNAMRDIVRSILESRVPVVVYVVPGGRAASAGTFIAMAAHIVAMAPGTAIGAAHPVAGAGQELTGKMEEKVTNDAAEYIRSLAKMRGRNADWVADEAVRKAKSLDAESALKEGVIDLVAPDLESLLRAIEGRKVRLDSREVILRVENAQRHTTDMNLIEEFLFTISDPNIAYILLSLAMLALFFELANPGAVFPGVLGGIALLLALYALGTLQANWAGVLLIGLAFILFLAEVFVTSHGVLGAGAIAAFILGSLMLWGNKAPPGLALDKRLVAAVAAAVSLFFLLVVQAVVRAHRRRPTTGYSGLLGKTGVAKTPLNPNGVVFVEGERWQARVDGTERIEAGEEVLVTRVEGLKLWVTKKDKGGEK